MAKARVLAKLRTITPPANNTPEEVLRKFGIPKELWKGILWDARTVVGYQKIGKGEGKPPSKAIRKFLYPPKRKSKPEILREWARQAEKLPDCNLSRRLEGCAVELELYDESADPVARNWYHSYVRDLVNSIKAAGVADFFQCASQLLSALGVYASPDALKVEYHKRTDLPRESPRLWTCPKCEVAWSMIECRCPLCKTKRPLSLGK